jgi:uncharacterized protein with ATP-grasp and redox domains
MKTYLDCIPCFYKQALVAARMSGADEEKQKEILDKVAEILPRFPLSKTPVEMANNIYGMIREKTGVADPYRAKKRKSNRMAMELYPMLKKKVEDSSDPLLIAVELAIAGNVIDYVSRDSIDLQGELSEIISREEESIKGERGRDFDYDRFTQELKEAQSVLYLADNAGETVFDRLLIEEIGNLGVEKEIVYAVKERPIINDALIEDARFCGIDEVARVVSCGSPAPGTVLELCSEEFMRLFQEVDVIISKGQGNFEALSGVPGPIFFLFLVKCPVIARDAGCDLGDVILRRSQLAGQDQGGE